MPPTKARFSFIYRSGLCRLYAAYGWVVFMALTAQFWLGGTGVGLTLMFATRWLRGLVAARGRPRLVTLAGEHLAQSWMLPSVICVEERDGSRHWWFREEMSSSSWAALRRFVRMYMPRQALGLSISR